MESFRQSRRRIPIHDSFPGQNTQAEAVQTLRQHDFRPGRKTPPQPCIRFFRSEADNSLLFFYWIMYNI